MPEEGRPLSKYLSTLEQNERFFTTGSGIFQRRKLYVVMA
jgi:hypothetical protein